MALRFAQAHLSVPVFAAVLALSACAGQPPGPASGLRGVGTPGVSAYIPWSYGRNWVMAE